ncbi:tetratricopeptide repeat protein [Varunaivibrio sulfuroxidans]|uniref:Sel1 repeat-containing protein n=1 Tax=Varunaivibrio sulfuroxidans TaxID=1773489 RepID=A0A4V2UN39_9PROT|nr:tetratricopeptide repeat protein [Varunaivibrio sulfuroxidans]TCS60561.1 Sel1 repeat-containing protein [Varunaivibrio sulfuroxidans]WES30051.1 tetratricopeptide repeat protein [Varunaivibrio sulfuroxidans]
MPYTCQGEVLFPPAPGGMAPFMRPGCLVAGFFFILILTFSSPAQACGWGGDGDGDIGAGAATVDGQGHLLAPGEIPLQTPGEITREANKLRRFGPSGYAGAVRLYRRAAAAGYPAAQNNLGEMYERGLGVGQNLKTAAHWYRLAAVQGEAHAQHSLGGMLLYGRGVVAAPEEGVAWLEKSARQGHGGACIDLARAYGEGRGVARNAVSALAWAIVAQRLGEKKGAQLRQTASRGLSSSAIAAAERLSFRFVSRGAGGRGPTPLSITPLAPR